MLLDNGANIYAKDNDGCTPLIYASNNGHKDIVQMLLDNGANVEVLKLKIMDGLL